MTLPFREWRRLRRRSLDAQRRDQSEICGLLGIDGQSTLFLYFAKNLAEEGAWRLSREDIEQIEETIRENGHKPIGTFHSHPISGPIPGKRDKEAMDYAKSYQLIYDVCGMDARLWQMTENDEIREIPMRTIKSPNSMKKE